MASVRGGVAKNARACSFDKQVRLMPRDPKALSMGDLAKYGHFDELRQMISVGADYDCAALFERAVTDFRSVRRNPGHFKILQWCLDQGLDLQSRAGWLNRSMFCLAAAAGNNEIVRQMWDKQRPMNPFMWAAVGEVELLRGYAAKHNLSDLRDENGFNLLFPCAESGLGRRDEEMRQRLTEVCRLLLDCGVNSGLEVDFELPISPSFLCAASGGNATIMDLLLEHGGLPAERFQLVMEHALEPHQRSGEPFDDVADCLLRHGFDINETNAAQGRTLLHGAAHRGTVKAVMWLLEQGADPNRLDSDGQTPLHRCAQRNTSPAVAKLLIAAGCRRNVIDSSGKSALDYARGCRRIKIVAFLEALEGHGSSH